MDIDSKKLFFNIRGTLSLIQSTSGRPMLSKEKKDEIAKWLNDNNDHPRFWEGLQKFFDMTRPDQYEQQEMEELL